MSNQTKQTSETIPVDEVGEGNRAADRRYREATEQFIASGKVAPAAAEAVRALDDDTERRELERAEEFGRAPARRAKTPAAKSAATESSRTAKPAEAKPAAAKRTPRGSHAPSARTER